MRKIKVKVLDENKLVEREFITTPEDLFLEEGWTEDDVDMALDGLREKAPYVFALKDGRVGVYDFEIVDVDDNDPCEKNGKVQDEEKPGKRKTNISNGVTELIAILDMSGSMLAYAEDTLGGFNGLIQEQKKDKEKVNITLVTFNSEYHKVFERTPIENVTELTRKDYMPTGTTALYDAIGKTIAEFDVPEGTKVMVSITTDGLENASREFRHDVIRQLIDKKEKEGWEFLFVGANMDAIKEAESIGINRDRAANYSQEHGGTIGMFSGLSKTLSAYKKNVSMDEAWEEGRAEIEKTNKGDQK